MRIDELLLNAEEPTFSFEFFPPRSEAGEANLAAALTELYALAPAFVSVTYGAGGSTRDRTVEIVSELKRRYGLEAMAHLTCVNATVSELRSTLDVMRGAGVKMSLHCAAIRRAVRTGGRRPTAVSNTHESSSSCCGPTIHSPSARPPFPRPHIHATSTEDDLRFLKAKVDAGASFLITQMFFDNAYYFDFVARARDIGIDVPIIPGVMPISALRASSAWRSYPRPSCLRGLRWSWRSDSMTTRLSRSSASRTPPCNASNCSNAARPASTSSHSIALQLLARSSPRCALRGHGTGSRARFKGANARDSFAAGEASRRRAVLRGLIPSCALCSLWKSSDDRAVYRATRSTPSESPLGLDPWAPDPLSWVSAPALRVPGRLCSLTGGGRRTGGTGVAPRFQGWLECRACPWARPSRSLGRGGGAG